jgi:rhodanese-related sulfurtransferase
VPTRIGIDELRALQAAAEPISVADVRSAAAWDESSIQAAGSIRLTPDRAVDGVRSLALTAERWIILYCT